ncbi:MAG: SRPBCC family protein [Planctomycetota bacterium]
MSLPSLDVHADIARAWTPPSWLYTDPDRVRLVQERVFSRTWQFVDAPLPEPEHQQPVTLHGEPLVLTCEPSGRRHLLSNVCTHRGTIVCEEAKRSAGLRCRYHGRRFRLDGGFTSMPEFEGAEAFPSESDNLPSLPLECRGPMAFTRLASPGPSFEDWFRPVEERLAWLPWSELRFDPERSRDYDVAANWILYCENYLEGFHIPFVHPTLNELVDYSDYQTELLEWGSLQVGIARRGEGVFDLPDTAPDSGRSVAAYYFWLFPNLMLNFYPWGLSLNSVLPTGIDRCRVTFRSFVHREDLLSDGAGGDLHTVELEDESVVQAVQRGVRSRFYDRGRYSPTRETGTHHFHRLLDRWLQAGNTT